MNAAEERAVLALAKAGTPHDKRRALGEFRSRGVRMTEGARRELAQSSVVPAVPQSLASTKHTTSLEPGAAPVVLEGTARRVREWAEMWLRAELFPAELRPGALLLHGPTGTGKTTATKWCASLLSDRYHGLCLDAHDWVSSHLGESGNKLSGVFASLNASPQLLAMEEIDVVAARRGGDGSAAGECDRITVAIMRLLDAARFPVICTTNRLDALDPALIRRFDLVEEFPEPTPEAKREIVHGLGVCGCVDTDAPIAELVQWAKAKRRREILATPTEPDAPGGERGAR